MREIITHTETIEKEELIAVTCNCCGKVSDENVWASDIEIWEHEFGYGSQYDMDKVSMDICDDCYKKWIDSFVHPPKIITVH